MVLNQWVHSGSEESWLCSLLPTLSAQLVYRVLLEHHLLLHPCSSSLVQKAEGGTLLQGCSAIPKLEETKGTLRHLIMSGSIWGVQCSWQWGKGKKGKVWLRYSEQLSLKAGIWPLWWSDCVVPTLHRSCSQFFSWILLYASISSALDASSLPQLLLLPLQLLYLNTYISSYLLPAFWSRPPVNSEWLPEAILTASTSLFSLLWSISIVTFAKR